MPSAKPNAHIKPELSVTSKEFMQDRVIYKMNAYTRLSSQYKLWYQLSSVVGIVCAATVPVLINLGSNTVVPTILSLIVTILLSLEKLFHFREHWRNYDAIAALLRSEQLQFQTKAGPYRDKKDSEEAFRLFVGRIEEAIKDERSDTITMRTKEMSS